MEENNCDDKKKRLSRDRLQCLNFRDTRVTRKILENSGLIRLVFLGFFHWPFLVKIQGRLLWR